MNYDNAYKLKNYVFYKATPDGIVFEAGAESFAIKGKQLYPIVSKFIHLMDIGYTARKIIDAIPEKITPLFENLLRELQRNNMLFCQISDSRKILDAEQVPNSEFVKFLQDNIDIDFSDKLEQWRLSNLLIIGDGYALKSAMSSLLETGIGQIDLLYTGGQDVSPNLEEILSIESDQTDSRFVTNIDQINLTTAKQGLRLSKYRIALFLTDKDILDCYAFHELRHAMNETPFNVAFSDGKNGYVSPMNSLDSTNIYDLLENTPDIDKSAADFSNVAASILGSISSLNALYEFFDFNRDQIRNRCSVVNGKLEIDQHLVLPGKETLASKALEKSDFVKPYDTPEGRPVYNYELLLMDLAPSFDKTMGVLKLRPERKLGQLPLFHDSIELRYPKSTHIDKDVIIAWGISAEDAGMRVMGRALKQYAKAQHQCRKDSSIVAAFDYEEWLKEAIAVAIVNQLDFKRTAKHFEITSDSIQDERANMLLRIIRLYHDRNPEIRLAYQPGSEAYIATSNINGIECTSVSYDPVKAIVESLGEICSQLQHPQLPKSINVINFEQSSEHVNEIDLDQFQQIIKQNKPIKVIATPKLLSPIFPTESYFVGSVDIEMDVTNES